MRINKSNILLLWRSGFGPKLEWLGNELQPLLEEDKAELLKWIFGNIEEYKPISEYYVSEEVLFEEDKAEYNRQRETDGFFSACTDWLTNMRKADNPMREKAALFWHHHIPSEIHDVESGILLLEIYRKHALGDLKSLLTEIISNRSFLFYLTGIRSRKENPNENLPRELLELYTLGKGHYTEKDIKEISRAFTGVSRYSGSNEIFIHDELIDNGTKNILGQIGHFNRYDVIDIILEHPRTAEFICENVLRFYGHENFSDIHLKDCSAVYRDSGYVFLHLLQYIFSSAWFVNDPIYQKKVKTPVELLVGFQRQTGYRLIGLKSHKETLSKLGQIPFQPYNVAGWPGGERWLQGNALLQRFFLLSALIDIANRPFARDTLAYKLFSRWTNPNLRTLRYTTDGYFSFDNLNSKLKNNGIALSEWMINNDIARTQDNSLNKILQSLNYQYC